MSTDTTAADVRPFTVDFPPEDLDDLRATPRRDPLAREGDRPRRVPGRAAGDDAGARRATGASDYDLRPLSRRG